jgi:predicted ABC-type ATPase
MSSPDKIDFLAKAQTAGYRTYLYYVATEDPAINISRVRERVEKGGHPVPEDKIVSRYYRSLELLMDAVLKTNRAYIFDNSGSEHVWIAEITDSRVLEMKTDQITNWFKTALWDKFTQAAALGEKNK